MLKVTGAKVLDKTAQKELNGGYDPGCQLPFVWCPIPSVRDCVLPYYCD